MSTSCQKNSSYIQLSYPIFSNPIENLQLPASRGAGERIEVWSCRGWDVAVDCCCSAWLLVPYSANASHHLANLRLLKAHARAGLALPPVLSATWRRCDSRRCPRWLEGAAACMNHGDENNADEAVTAGEQLVACIEESLGLFLFDNAAFLAERLLAQQPNDVSAPRPL